MLHVSPLRSTIVASRRHAFPFCYSRVLRGDACARPTSDECSRRIFLGIVSPPNFCRRSTPHDSGRVEGTRLISPSSARGYSVRVTPASHGAKHSLDSSTRLSQMPQQPMYSRRAIEQAISPAERTDLENAEWPCIRRRCASLLSFRSLSKGVGPSCFARLRRISGRIPVQNRESI